MSDKYQQDIKSPVMWDEFTAYFTGYVLGDGCILPPRASGLKKDGTYYWRNGGVKVTSKDRDVIEMMSENLGWLRPLSVSKGLYYTLTFTSTEWYNFFTSLGIVSRKSFNPSEVNFPEGDYLRHFIRGLFDADGSVMYHHPGKPRLFIGGHPSYIQALNNTLCWSTHIHGNIMELWLHDSHRVYEFYHYLYDNATYFMNRKKLKFEELCR